MDVRRSAADNETCAEGKAMKDTAKKYAKMFSKAMKKLGRSDHKRLERVFYKRYTAHLNSEMYQKYCKTYPSIGTDKVYIGITFAQIMLKLGYSLDEAIEAWKTYMMADKLRMIESIIRLADFFGKGYRICGNWLDKDKETRDQDGSILYEFYHYNNRELEYKIHTCAYVTLFEHYHIRKFCKAFCNNDLCMCVLRRSAKFIRYSDRVDGDYCHDKLINPSR